MIQGREGFEMMLFRDRLRAVRVAVVGALHYFIKIYLASIYRRSGTFLNIVWRMFAFFVLVNFRVLAISPLEDAINMFDGWLLVRVVKESD